MRILQFLVVGSHWGMIYVLDHLGNAARGHELQAHAVSVNQISLDSEGDYIASCSDDGRVSESDFGVSEQESTKYWLLTSPQRQRESWVDIGCFFFSPFSRVAFAFQIVVHGWYSSENSHNLTFDHPVKSVALDPNYFKPRSGRKFLTGEFLSTVSMFQTLLPLLVRLSTMKVLIL